MILLDLPLETLDHIVSTIASPADLANLGEACRLLHSIVSPNHTQFREIRAPLLLPVWSKLAENHSLAQNVRIIEVQSVELYQYSDRVDDPLIPGVFRDLQIPQAPVINDYEDDDGDPPVAARAYDAAKNVMHLGAERVFVAALKGMVNLTSFKWSRTPTLIDPAEEEDVWTVLRGLPCLTDVDVVDREKPYEGDLGEVDDPAYHRPTFSTNFFSLKSLKSFSFITEAYNTPSAGKPNLDCLATMLVNDCPDLEVLKLSATMFNNTFRTVPGRILLRGAWASLKEVQLRGVECLGELLFPFLAAHPTIEVLSLLGSTPMMDPSYISSAGSLPIRGLLPRLRIIRGTPLGRLLLAIMTSSLQSPRPLEEMVGAIPSESFLHALKQSGSGSNVKRIVFWSLNDVSLLTFIPQLAVIVPNLESLVMKFHPQNEYGVSQTSGTFRVELVIHVVHRNPSMCPQVVATATRHSLTRFQTAPRITRRLPRSPKTGLPQPHVKIITREFAPCRLEDHYHTTLKDDLMYMTYTHQVGEAKQPRQIRLKFDPNDPYSKYRRNTPVGGSQIGKKPAPPSSPDNIVRLEKIQLHTMVKEAVSNKGNLLGAMMQMKALTGESFQAGGQHAVQGIELVRGKKSVGGWLRPGVPVGVKVDLRGQAMYDFLGTLVEFVLPRLRDFSGIVLPPSSSSVNTPSAVSGVVSFGLPAQAIVFFPQIEVNVDSYSKLYGMHIHFVTNARGVGAQDRARALVSGYQIPFIRK
ncbi:unnamed protein product [Cyclocybe aegerita]|uniref:F-box domain-containing protein n=1 Tax=Cyclocybe aegerita TaxID=1973307 RepID=A0A8S0WLS0_CYCAE|nr:unnamed protein product [Cyclocybe aegerita]